MIVDPWGQVIASVPDGVGLAIAELDLDRVRRVRQSMPVEEHRRARRVEL
jgi:nitrilase